MPRQKDRKLSLHILTQLRQYSKGARTASRAKERDNHARQRITLRLHRDARYPLRVRRKDSVLKKDSSSQFGFFNRRMLAAFTFCLAGVGLALLSVSANPPSEVARRDAKSSRDTLATGQVRRGIYRGIPVTYVVKNGKAIFQGDIILDKVDPIDPRTSATCLRHRFPRHRLQPIPWPRVGNQYQIPYIITSGSGNLTNLNTAIAQFNSTFPNIKFVARTAQTDYVNFYFDPNDNSAQCEATLGRAGGEQQSEAQVDRSTPAPSAPSCTKWDTPSVSGTSNPVPIVTPTSPSITAM